VPKFLCKKKISGEKEKHPKFIGIFSFLEENFLAKIVFSSENHDSKVLQNDTLGVSFCNFCIILQQFRREYFRQNLERRKKFCVPLAF
jgi:hypothetical protein